MSVVHLGNIIFQYFLYFSMILSEQMWSKSIQPAVFGFYDIIHIWTEISTGDSRTRMTGSDGMVIIYFASVLLNRGGWELKSAVYWQPVNVFDISAGKNSNWRPRCLWNTPQLCRPSVSMSCHVQHKARENDSVESTPHNMVCPVSDSVLISRCTSGSERRARSGRKYKTGENINFASFVFS